MTNEEKITKQLQKKELDMLRIVDRIMTENEIPYFLACGTAIGCVRHEGFIPWDDDVDLYVFGKDLEKIRKVFKENQDSLIEYQDSTCTKDYPYIFPKFVAKNTCLVEKSLSHTEYRSGIYIDVFPLYTVSDSRIMRYFDTGARYFRYCLVRGFYMEYESGIKKLISTLIKKFINPKKIQDKLLASYNRYDTHKKYLVEPPMFGKTAFIRRKLFDDNVRMKFEGYEFSMPKGYDTYLRNYYGNYMKLPAKEERRSNHEFIKLSF